MQWFFVQPGLLALTGELPGCDIREVLVVAQRLALGRLALFAEVAAARLGAVERIQAHEFG